MILHMYGGLKMQTVIYQISKTVAKKKRNTPIFFFSFIKVDPVTAI